ncbi:right-handed parallel beta-helix repeat-containing protein [Acidobacteria bacterium AH-259-A15]|nr:right-handed parallel beta-helix repeat-containing protein [Acidobacteria bacterium AH-259-A15]
MLPAVNATSDPFNVVGFCETGSMGTPRKSHTATLLPNGLVLITGGLNGVTPLASAELYDPATGTFSSTGSMGAARHNHTATLLPNGKVLITGGFADPGISLDSAELYDPATNSFSATAGNMVDLRGNHTATLLPSGKVLIAGGFAPAGLTSAELYDPATDTFAATGSMVGAFRGGHTATLLPSGKVLIVGGNSLLPTELYDPTLGTFSATGNMGTARRFHTATLLASGQVLVSGGFEPVAPLILDTAELYDPAAGTFGSTDSMSEARAGHTATLLPLGKVLIAGGSGATTLATTEVYDPATTLFSLGVSMSTARAEHTATLLPSGQVLISGGAGSTLDSAELFHSSVTITNLTDLAENIFPPDGAVFDVPVGELFIALPIIARVFKGFDFEAASEGSLQALANLWIPTTNIGSCTAAPGPTRAEAEYEIGQVAGTVSGTATVLTADARAGIIPDPCQPGNLIVPVPPAAVPSIDLQPVPNGADLGDGTAEFVSADIFNGLSDQLAFPPGFTQAIPLAFGRWQIFPPGTYTISLTVDIGGAIVTAATSSFTVLGRVSWWPGDGDADDHQGGNDGTLQNGTTFAPGQVGQAFSFDGVDDVVDAPGSGINDLQQLTIAAWVKHDSLNGPLDPFGIQRYVTLRPIEKAVIRHDGGGTRQLHFYMRIDGLLRHIRVNNVLQTGVFQHVVGTYDGSDMRLYLDGVEVGNLSISGVVATGTNVTFSSTVETLDGRLDEVQIFNRALTPAEVLQIFDAERGTTFTVNSTGDESDAAIDGVCETAGGSNDCTLRAAIQEANSNPGLDVIQFDIPAGGNCSLVNGNTICTITPSVSGTPGETPLIGLPPITDPVIIDGSLADGTPGIEIDGSAVPEFDSNCALVPKTCPGDRTGRSRHIGVHGLVFCGVANEIQPGVLPGSPEPENAAYLGGTLDPCFNATFIGDGAHDNTVRGLIVNRFSFAGLYFYGSDRNTVVGNYLGLDKTGELAGFGNGRGDASNPGGNPRGHGIRPEGSDGNIIGTTDPRDRNVIGGNNRSGIAFTGLDELLLVPDPRPDLSDDNTIQGNYIGTNKTGDIPVGNSSNGIFIGDGGSQNNLIGGLGEGEGNVIAASGRNGLGISGTAVQVLGNLIGTDKTGGGGTPFGQTLNGVALGCTGCTISENVISRSGRSGIRLRSFAAGTIVTDNLISKNDFDGIRLLSSDNTIRDNTISSNGQFGIHLLGPSSTGNTIFHNNIIDNGFPPQASDANPADNDWHEPTLLEGNHWSDYTGVDDGSGTGKHAIAGDGIGDTLIPHPTTDFDFFPLLEIFDAEVGTTFTVNLTGDGGDAAIDGVCETVAGSNDCTLRAALEETNATSGTDTIGFDIPGEGPHTIQPTSALPTITDPVIIDGYTQPGAAAATSGTPATLMIELDGRSAGANVGGLTIAAPNSTVRGLVINRFDGVGLLIEGTGGNTIAGNYIGTDFTGTVGPGNSGAGVAILDSPSNTIGGTASGAGNVISGNAVEGVYIAGNNSTGNLVRSNFIGTDFSGTAALGNAHGVIIDVFASNNTIGGTDPDAGNVISASDFSGVGFTSSAEGNFVEGNFIGTDVTGTVALGNSEHGVFVNASNNTIGGTVVGAGNIISSNGLDGVVINEGMTGVFVQGNFIGTDATGNLDLGNASSGVAIADASDNLVGGPVPGARNVISGNDGSGVAIFGSGATGNQVQGNYIGTDVNGTADLGNVGDGVVISNDASSNTVGGTAPGAGNLIAFNGSTGVIISGAIGNAILSNAVFSNGDLGIDLDDDGVTLNDAGDPDAGANDLQNFPVISGVTGGDTIEGSFNSTSNTQFRLEFFASTACDPSGQGEGETFLGFTDVTTDGSGDAAFSTTLPAAIPGGQFVTATATDPNDNTSEFSACVSVI